MKTLLRIITGVFLGVAALTAFDVAFPQQAAKNALSLQRAISGLTLKQAQIPGFDIPYLEGGPADGEPLVLVHGIGADKDHFDRVAMLLTPTMRVISLDLPGFGDASKPADADYGIAQQVERLDQFLTALGIRKAHIGGNSMGGWITATYAATYPSKVSSLWLIDAAGVGGGKPSDVRTAYADRGEYLLFSKTPEDLERVAGIVMSKPPFLPYSVKYVTAHRAVANYDLHTRIFRDLVKAAPQTTLEPKVKGLAIPTLITWGAEDRATDVSGAKILQQLMPQSEVHILDGIGHLPQLEAPQPIARRYLDFRAKL